MSCTFGHNEHDLCPACFELDGRLLGGVFRGREMTAQKVLIAGGAGYIGSHAAKALHRAGRTPVVFDNLSTGHREAVKWGPLVEGDIRDAEAV